MIRPDTIRHERPLPAHRWSVRTVLLLGAALLTVGAGACGGSRPETELFPQVAVGPPPPPEVDTAGAGLRSAEATLTLADSLLAQGAFDAAAAAYGQVAQLEQDVGPDPLRELRARALWGTALTQLLAPEAATSSEPTLRVLRTLTDDYAGTSEAAQARVLTTMLQELDRLRVDGMRKEEHIRRLNETVEQLKRIDLSRRPGG